jgi:hypothetical protein
VTIAIAPLWDETAALVKVIWADRNRNVFANRTGQAKSR